MTIKNITELKNKSFPSLNPVKEVMSITIPDIITDNIPKRNGFIWVLSGSGGSGKTSLMLNFFKNSKLYKGVFHNIYYFSPISSYLSVDKHPFTN